MQRVYKENEWGKVSKRIITWTMVPRNEKKKHKWWYNHCLGLMIPPSTTCPCNIMMVAQQDHDMSMLAPGSEVEGSGRRCSRLKMLICSLNPLVFYTKKCTCFTHFNGPNNSSLPCCLGISFLFYFFFSLLPSMNGASVYIIFCYNKYIFLQLDYENYNDKGPPLPAPHRLSTVQSRSSPGLDSDPSTAM